MVDRIRALCNKNNTTIKQLERDLGIGNGIIARWAKSKPSYERLKMVADALGVTPEYLLTGETAKAADPEVSGLSEYDIKALEWFHSLSPEKRRAILALADGPEELAEAPGCE